jgi:hypothetical protein
VLSAVTTFSACLRCLFGMWLYVVYVCACLMYLSVGCLDVTVHNQTSHRQVHPGTHTQTSYSHIPNKQRKQAEKVVIALSMKDDPLKMVKQL